MDWFEEWFDTPYYHILYNNRDYKEAESFILALTKELNLPEKAKVVDLACGKGRHSVFLNKLGFDVLGLDLSQQSIAFDKKFENPNLKFEVHDMRNALPITDADAVFNLFTSFGYFETEEEDLNVFRSVNQGLKSGGLFVLDYLNREFVENGIVDSYNEIRDDLTFHIHKEIKNNYIVKEINFQDQDGVERQYFERVKLHTSEKIKEYAEKSGFERVKIWGDYQLNGFDVHTSPRCITLFRKK